VRPIHRSCPPAVLVVVHIGVLVSAVLASALVAAPRWVRVRTPNFVVVSNASASQAGVVAQQLEQFRDVIGRVLPNASVATERPALVVVFATERDYRPYKPLHEGKPVNVAGFFISDGLNTTISMHLGRDEESYPIIFHEYTHLFMREELSRVPLWFVEGMAEYFSTFTLSANRRQASIGRPVLRHVQRLRERFLPLADVLRMDRASLRGSDERTVSLFYAESWALVHFALHGSGNGVEQLQRVLVALQAGTATDQAVREAFGRSVSDLERDVRDYLLNFAYQYLVYEFDERIARVASGTETLTEAETKEALGTLLARLNRPAEAEKLLEEALRLDDGLPEARQILHEIQLRRSAREGREDVVRRAGVVEGTKDRPPTTAEEWLSDARDAYSRAPIGEEQAEERNAALEQARAGLLRAIELRADFADALGLLGEIEALRGQWAEAERAFHRALELVPDRAATVERLASVYIEQQKFDLARLTLTGFIERAGPENAVLARAWLADLDGRELRARERADLARLVAETPGAEPMTAAPAAASSSPRYFFRVLQPGEMRSHGLLMAIDCTKTTASLLLKTVERTMRLHVEGLDKVDFIAYRNDLTGSVGCGPREAPLRVYVTWRPWPPAKARSDPAVAGTVVAVEFLPRDW
jgi:tetratricopeptide (TPR) repeat protein